MARLYLVYITIFFAWSCSSRLQHSGLREGYIQVTTEYPGFTDTTYSQMAFNWIIVRSKWYKKNLVIAERVSHNTYIEKGVSRDTLITTGYLFMDFKTNMAAEYLAFSDTAQPIQSFDLRDTVKLTGGDIHLGTKFDTTPISRHIVMLADTIIDKIFYKRAVRFYSHNVHDQPRPYVEIYYFRPDLSEDLSRIEFWSDSLTRALKAPTVWVENRPTVTSPIILGKLRLAFLADTLTTQERKVFAAWKKNEK